MSAYLCETCAQHRCRFRCLLNIPGNWKHIFLSTDRWSVEAHFQCFLPNSSGGYDAFTLDQYGVLHNGRAILGTQPVLHVWVSSALAPSPSVAVLGEAYPGAAECVAQMKANFCSPASSHRTL